MNGTMLAPMHSGTGANGSFLLLQPAVATTMEQTMRRRRMLPSGRLRRSIANRFHAVNRSATVVCTLLVAIAIADAHPEFAPSTVNRYVKIDLVGPDELRLAYTTMVGPAPAAVWRRAADANANGLLDADETRIDRRARRASGARRAARSPSTEGASCPRSRRPTSVSPATKWRRARSRSISIARIPLTRAATHTVRFDDATPEPQLGETEVLHRRIAVDAPHRRAPRSRRHREGDALPLSRAEVQRARGSLDHHRLQRAGAAAAQARADRGDGHGSSCPRSSLRRSRSGG